MTHLYFIDESGDLGWSFDLPYGRGGSSRYLVIAAVGVPLGREHQLERVMKDLFRASKWDAKREKKWIDTPLKARDHFAEKTVTLVTKHADISLHAIVVDKRNVAKHLRDDGNKLYNYMVKLLLIDELAKHASVQIMPDARSIKVQSGNSMHDYLSICLGYELRVATHLRSLPTESAHSKPLQFVDMLSGTVHAHFEFGKSQWHERIRPHLRQKTLFF